MKFTKKNWFKTIAISLIFCMIATTGAFAASTQNNREAELSALTQLGITGATPVTDNELEKIQGEWLVYGAVAGGFAGAIGYASYVYGSGSAWSWNSFAWNTGIGAASGFISGPMAIATSFRYAGTIGAGSYLYGRYGR